MNKHDQFHDPKDELLAILHIACDHLEKVEPRQMSHEQLVRAAWGYLRVEEPDLTLEEAREAFR